MGLKTKIALSAFLLFCSPNLEVNSFYDCQTKTEETAKEDYYRVSNIKLKRAYSLKELIHKNNYAYKTSRENLVKDLSSIANNKEFSLVYFQDNELLVHLKSKSRKNSGRLNRDKLNELVDTLEFRLIHNHDNLNSEYFQGNPLSCIGLSPTDINQYLFFNKEYPKMDYSVVTEYGMLTAKRNFKKFDPEEYPSLYMEILLSEAMRMQSSLRGISQDSITQWAENYRGNLKLSFEKSDKINK